MNNMGISLERVSVYFKKSFMTNLGYGNQTV
jgi:hypothetical protein